MQCSFLGLMLAAGPFSAHITVEAPNVASSFRAPITAADITVSPSGGTINSFSLTLSPSTGNASLSFDLSQPVILFQLTNFTITIRNLPDAAIITVPPATPNDPRMTWFLSNNWNQHTYYAAAPGATVNAAPLCDAAGGANCLTANGLDASTGIANNKRLVLALMGRRLASQPSTCAAVADCLEGQNASTGDDVFANAPASSTFNDRLAVCPFQLTPQSGPPVTVCN